MTNGRRKHKRGERGSTEEEINSAKKANLDEAACDDEESDAEPYEEVPEQMEQEPSLKELKYMLSGVQTTLKDIQRGNRKMRDELAELKSSFGIQERQLNSLKASLSKVTKANDEMKIELQANVEM
ncbi:hypothetical protein OS493_035646 [Desmophyllum pertusum]|uniref:Uncharacterized protein n=1 Tax=Desmophyllum pertusum TaxID=174260 RepID=A0A9W9Z7J7_9CNID|nr:hypothetical protein OS493_035646 [Desmophyllum pertusum]